MSLPARAARVIVAAVLLLGAVLPCAAAPFEQEALRIPLPAGSSGSLEALLVRPSGPGRYPLALINHGSPRAAADRPQMTPLSMLPEAMEFARRGWAAAIVMRRGYGGSGGGWAETFGRCGDPHYLEAARAAAADLKDAAVVLARRPDVDDSRIISVGVSAGGFATVALTADPPPGLVAAISFAGGRGSTAADQVCRGDRLADAFHALGERSRIPMLWVYADNDHFFGPQLAQALRQAFTSGGGKVEFVRAAPFGQDGHGLFSQAGIPIWTGYVDAFLQRQNLVLRANPLPPPLSALATPAVLGPNGKAAFESYKTSPPHKAFAVAPDGRFGWQSGMRTTDAARAGALKYCLEGSKQCGVVFVDDSVVAK
jgi:dienelactone hydrolase